MNSAHSSQDRADESLHLVVDAQCLQTETLQRGIGRFSISLLQALAAGFPQSTVTLLLNRIADSRWGDQLHRLLLDGAPANLKTHYFESPTAFWVQFSGARRVAEASRESAIEELEPDAVLILSAFQGDRQTILSTRRVTKKIPTYAVLYDLIPLHFPDYFLYTPSLRSAYLRRLAVLRDCDGLLAISKATKRSWQDLIADEPPVTVIGGATTESNSSPPSLPITERRGVLCLGAETPNKNLETLLAAYAKLPAQLRSQHPLSILGIRDRGFSRYLRSHYRGDSKDLLIPGYVTEEQLRGALRSSRVLVMPSTMEGLGLPVLEAMAVGTPCLVADGSSLVELTSNPAGYFPPHDVERLASLLQESLSSDSMWFNLQKTAISDAAAADWRAVSHHAHSVLFQS